MAAGSVSGINIKIGADLSDLQKNLGQVGKAVEDSVTPAQAQSVKDLAKNFKDVKEESRQSKINIAAVASAVARIGAALAGLTKGILEEAVKTNPETAKTVEDLKTSFAGIKSAVVDAVVPLIEKYGPQLTALFDSIAQWIADHPQLTTAIFSIAAAIGFLAPAISTVLPFLTLFNISLAPISGTALLVVGGIAALVAVVALLSGAFHDGSTSLREFNGDIESLEPKVESLVEVAGQTFVQDKFTHAEGAVDVNGNVLSAEDWVQWDDFQMGWVPATAEELAILNGRLTETSELAGGATESLTGETVTDEVTATIDEATDAAASAQQIYDDLVKSNAELSAQTVSSTDDINDSIQAANDFLQNETFQQFSQVPIDDAVSSSWATFGESVRTAAGGYSDLSTELDKNTAAGKITDIGGAAQASAGMFDQLTQSINNTIDALRELATVNGGGGKSGSTVPLAELRASGGPVAAGAPYIVGEQGPELFVPQTRGEIIPNNVYENINSRELVINTGPIYGESYLKDYVLKVMTGQIRRELRLAS